ncbi:RelA/SpoT domain protein [Bengtsoniella intestinalis]|uniref:GTP pyrophosphokinase n=1 Tax=Bengtsoniella intestinalis TaxID=3073143 RepID=UPI00391FA82B
MDTTTFYGDHHVILEEATQTILTICQQIKTEKNCIEHINSRLKSPASVEKKLCKHGHCATPEAAIAHLTDLVGIRLVCRFICDIYTVAELLQSQCHVVTVKDYIANPKPNGYRSYHMILMVPTTHGHTVAVEVQLRTISQDAWACLEHQLKYKKEIHAERLVREELKRCADDLASTDLCMQTLREFIDMDSHIVWDG